MIRVILTIAAKDLRLLLRDRTNAFFVIVFPLAIAIFFGSILAAVAAAFRLRLF